MLDPAAKLGAGESGTAEVSAEDTVAAARLSRSGTLVGDLGTGSSTVPSVPDTPGAVPARRGAGRSARSAYTIRAQAVTGTGAVFVRETVVRLARHGDTPYTVLEWRQGTMK